MAKGDMVYPVRFAETLLLCAETSLTLDNLYDALTCINEFGFSSASTSEEIRAELPGLWSTYLDREGLTFIRLKRSGTETFLNTLGQYGATEKHLLLPIPQSAMSANPLLTQNPGW